MTNDDEGWMPRHPIGRFFYSIIWGFIICALIAAPIIVLAALLTLLAKLFGCDVSPWPWWSITCP